MSSSTPPTNGWPSSGNAPRRRCGMFFVASATIAAEHSELSADVESIDEHLFRHDGVPLRADVTAEILDIDRGRFSRLMGLLADKGAVKKVVGYVCPTCDG